MWKPNSQTAHEQGSCRADEEHPAPCHDGRVVVRFEEAGVHDLPARARCTLLEEGDCPPEPERDREQDSDAREQPCAAAPVQVPGQPPERSWVFRQRVPVHVDHERADCDEEDHLTDELQGCEAAARGSRVVRAGRRHGAASPTRSLDSSSWRMRDALRWTRSPTMAPMMTNARMALNCHRRNISHP